MEKIAVITDRFALGTPVQELLDRALVGFPMDGVFRRPDLREVVLFASEGANEHVKRRVDDYGLKTTASAEAALEGAAAAIVAQQGSSFALLPSVLDRAAAGTRVFYHGVPGRSLREGRQLAQVAKARNVFLLCSATALPVTWRLPQVDLPMHQPVREALIVVQGKAGQAELEALEGLLPLVERRGGGEGGVKSVTRLDATSLWPAGEKDGFWSKDLLAAAISRSDSPLGDPERDGRTQDLFGMGLVPKLARDPRGWVLEHDRGMRSTILVLDGVVRDFNFAVRMGDGEVISAQLYRPPGHREFDRLAAVVEDFFDTGRAPWPVERSLLIAGLLEVFRSQRYLPVGERLATPELAGIRYRV